MSEDSPLAGASYAMCKFANGRDGCQCANNQRLPCETATMAVYLVLNQLGVDGVGARHLLEGTGTVYKRRQARKETNQNG